MVKLNDISFLLNKATPLRIILSLMDYYFYFSSYGSIAFLDLRFTVLNYFVFLGLPIYFDCFVCFGCRLLVEKCYFIRIFRPESFPWHSTVLADSVLDFWSNLILLLLATEFLRLEIFPGKLHPANRQRWSFLF